MNRALIQIAVLWRPGRNVEWHAKFTGQNIPDDAVEEAIIYRDGLRDAGYRAELVKWREGDLAAVLTELRQYDLIFNPSSLEEVALLQVAGLLFCGSALDLVALSKATRKKLWVYHGVPTPPFFVIDRDELAGGPVTGWSELADERWELPSGLGYPLFVKPVRGRGSSGITDDSIVSDRDGLRRQARAIITSLDQGALVESYQQGKEISVGIIGDPPTVLTPLEIEYNEAQTNTYEHKKDNEIFHCPPRLDNLEVVRDVAIKAFLSLGARDQGRVDMIIDEDGNPSVLELNTFPGLQILTGDERHLHSSYIGVMAEHMGLQQRCLMGRIVASALRRFPADYRGR